MKKLIIFSVILIMISCKKVEQNGTEIPNGAIWNKETIRHDLPISGYSAFAVWAQAATLNGDQSLSEDAKVTIDFMEVLEITISDTLVVFTENYDYQIPKYFSTNEAGLYCRYPKWFDPVCNDAHETAHNMVAQLGFLNIDVAQTPNNIIHWWTPKLGLNSEAIYCIRARLKVDGKTSVQFGMDYWRTLQSGYNGYDPSCLTSNNCEAWITDWIGDTEGEFVTITLPKRK